MDVLYKRSKQHEERTLNLETEGRNKIRYAPCSAFHRNHYFVIPIFYGCFKCSYVHKKLEPCLKVNHDLKVVEAIANSVAVLRLRTIVEQYLAP